MADVREMRIFSAEQIVVQEDLPGILKNYSKEVIRNNPESVISFSRQYFEQLLKEEGYFDDHLNKLQITGKSMLFRKAEKITDHYEIGDMYSDSYYRKARVGVHKKTGIERAILQKAKSEYANHEAFVKKLEFFGSFDHPNIVRYLEVYEDENYYFLVTECLKGNDIIDQVWSEGKYSEDYAAKILKQILQGVAYIHSKGVAHNQLFPINILHVNPSQPEHKIIDLDEVGNQAVKDLDKFLRYGDYRGCYIAPETIKGHWNLKVDVWAVGVIAYYLLVGDVPFYGYDHKETLKLIEEYKFDQQRYEWTQLSEEARDLILRLMAYKHEERLSAVEALKHPFFVKAQKGELKDKDLGEVLTSIKKFHAGGKLKQAMQGFLTQNLLSQEELNNLAQQFRAFDKNGNGSLSRDELIDAYRITRGVNFNEKEIDELIERVDADGSGDINYSEFVNTAMSLEKLLTDDRLEKTFRLFDRDGNNEVTVPEIKQLLDACKQVDEKMITRAMKEVDRIGKGKLTFPEFKRFLKGLFEAK